MIKLLFFLFQREKKENMLLPIQGWDYTPTSCSSQFVPAFYFIPDYEWVSYLHINGTRNIPVVVSGTDKYDGKHWVRIDKQPETLWHIGFLSFPFTGYPPKMGNVELQEVKTQVLPSPFLQCELNGCC